MQIHCPFCGRRDETEFTYGGEAQIACPPGGGTDTQWAEYLYFRNNTKGVHTERWVHARGCGQWFVARRNTATHEFKLRDPAPDSPARPAQESPRG